MAHQRSTGIPFLSDLPPHWVLIRDWPGLGDYYPVKLTRAITKESLCEQFPGHVHFCSPSMDKVLCAIKEQKLRTKDDCYFFLTVISNFMDAPGKFLESVNAADDFEDFCIGQYCGFVAQEFLDSAFPRQYRKQFKKKLEVLSKHSAIRDKRKRSEAYLNITFSDDVRRSFGELWQLLKKIK